MKVVKKIQKGILDSDIKILQVFWNAGFSSTMSLVCHHWNTFFIFFFCSVIISTTIGPRFTEWVNPILFSESHFISIYFIIIIIIIIIIISSSSSSSSSSSIENHKCAVLGFK